MNSEDTDPLNMEEKDLTEHQLDTTCTMDLKNVTTKSVVLAPYNSSKSDIKNDSLDFKLSVYSHKDRILRIKNGKLREIDKEYEANNNANMDNGVFNTEDEKSRQPTIISQTPSVHEKSDPTWGSNSTRALTTGRQDSLQYNSSGGGLNEIDQVREELIKRKILD